MKHIREDTTQKRILVIDDDKYLTDAMQRLLSGHTYIVEACYTGQEGLQKAVAQPPDIILLDYLLPQEDSHRVLEKLQSQERTKNIPIVLISASSTAAVVAKEWKMTDFLPKPFQVHTLLQLVDKYTI